MSFIMASLPETLKIFSEILPRNNHNQGVYFSVNPNPNPPIKILQLTLTLFFSLSMSNFYIGWGGGGGVKESYLRGCRAVKELFSLPKSSEFEPCLDISVEVTSQC